ncbi:MAG: DNA-3-methyladenine glycosylase [Rhodothalassiaceae bacterium]
MPQGQRRADAEQDFRLSSAHIADTLMRLAEQDSDIADALARFGMPPERRSGEGFPVLLRIIVGQQVSVKAAATIFGRIETALGGHLVPEAFLALDEATVGTLGLSRQKLGYCRALAEAFASGALDAEDLRRLDDETAMERLTAVKGLGKWSARMYLMFSLGRPDIWPHDDLGVREGLRRLLGHETRPEPAQAEEIGRRWSPHRSPVALLCWHILHNEPV